MKALRLMSLVVMFVLTLALTGSANAADYMLQNQSATQAAAQFNALPVQVFADWYIWDTNFNLLRIDLDRFYNREATAQARLGSPTNAWKAQPNSVIWTNTAGKKFVIVSTGEQIDPFGPNGGRVVPLRRDGTLGVFAVYAQVWVTPGRGLPFDRPLNPSADLCGWGGPC